MRPPDRRKRAPGVKAGGVLRTWGGLSRSKRNTWSCGSVPLRVDIPARLRVLWKALKSFTGADRAAVELALRRVELEGRAR